jgi:RNase P subunit RPR2
MKKKVYREGEKSRGFCSNCDQVVQTTFQIRDLAVRSPKTTVKNLLVAVCSICDVTVAIPQQSVPKIKETLDALKGKTT